VWVPLVPAQVQPGLCFTESSQLAAACRLDTGEIGNGAFALRYLLPQVREQPSDAGMVGTFVHDKRVELYEALRFGKVHLQPPLLTES
jgi:hypothetical protein